METWIHEKHEKVMLESLVPIVDYSKCPKLKDQRDVMRDDLNMVEAERE